MRSITFSEEIKQGIPDYLPEHNPPNREFAHAPKRNINGLLSQEELRLAIANALRYFHASMHEVLAFEFREELMQYGRIYMYRFIPSHPIYARSIDDYPCKCKQAASIMLMIQNNLDPLVAKYPQELITYGGNGAVFQNWAQYRLCMKYLSEMTEEQTLVLYSGHPLGLYPSSKNAPRVVVTNGMMIPNYSKKEDWNKYNALGVTQYGQMTAGSFMYIGPQGIVHGTTLTLLNAGRLNGLGDSDLKGKLFVTSGLGGMSGAQSLASVICKAVCILAEVDPDAIRQRIDDGYIQESLVYHDLDPLIVAVRRSQNLKEAVSYVYAGNVVDLWEYLASHQIHVDLGSDQTSLHNIDDLGYCPVGFSFEEAKQLLNRDKDLFLQEVRKTLVRHVQAINQLSSTGMYFWDYGNAFLKEAGVAGADIRDSTNPNQYRYPSYVEDIMGPMCFDYGFGPFRWVCMSGSIDDLEKTDQIAAGVLEKLIGVTTGNTKAQNQDNLNWIRTAEKHLPVVGSKSRILYSDVEGRIEIALAFNKAIRNGELKNCIVLGRDHHDVSGTDSPFRETANIRDGSKFTADMAVHNVIGDAFRGATWVSLHNGGGVGWGEVINGGFGMVIDGSDQSEENIRSMILWDVANGISRRAWARNPGALEAAEQIMKKNDNLLITKPNLVDSALLNKII
ncbi:MAG: urocanate hydratase [Saprospiraceae bacterium]|nr:urocanate hydratase [Saprospiraceae bacterium]